MRVLPPGTGLRVVDLGQVAFRAVETTFDSRPPRRAARWVTLATLVLVASVAAPISVAGAATPPPKWAKAVCGATSAWVTQVAKAADLAAATVPESTATVKKTLGKLLSSTAKSTAAVRKKLAKAGSPSVPGGKLIAATVKEGFRQVESGVKQAKKSLAGTSTADPATFTTTLRGVQDALESGLEGIQAAFSATRDADAVALLDAFAATSSCSSITG